MACNSLSKLPVMAFSPKLTRHFHTPQFLRRPPRSSPLMVIMATTSAEPEKEKLAQTENKEVSKTSSLPKKPVYSMKKGQIVRVIKEKYLNSINYLSVGHPPYYKGLDYIYEDRGEVLDIRIFDTGEYALIKRMWLQLNIQEQDVLEWIDSSDPFRPIIFSDLQFQWSINLIFSLLKRRVDGGSATGYKTMVILYIESGNFCTKSGTRVLIAWVGIPTAPAWLPTDMLIKSDKLDYERI